MFLQALKGTLNTAKGAVVGIVLLLFIFFLWELITLGWRYVTSGKFLDEMIFTISLMIIALLACCVFRFFYEIIKLLKERAGR